MLECAKAHESDSGATAVEYALMVSLVAAVIFSIVFFLGNDVVSLFNSVSGAF